MGRARKVISTGDVFGKLTALRFVGSVKNDGLHWLMRCSCGKEVSMASRGLLSGKYRSCGCSRGEAHGCTKDPLYELWKGMHARCRNKQHVAYQNYGGRGIKVCKRWGSFSAFKTDMGPRPSPQHTVERSKNWRGYSPSNCYWATRAEQNRNTRKNKFVTLFEERLTQSEFARLLGLRQQTVWYRVKVGWSALEIFAFEIKT